MTPEHDREYLICALKDVLVALMGLRDYCKHSKTGAASAIPQINGVEQIARRALVGVNAIPEDVS
jgi:hypothetical protein